MKEEGAEPTLISDGLSEVIKSTRFPLNTSTHMYPSRRPIPRWRVVPVGQICQGPVLFFSRTILFNRCESLDFLTSGKAVGVEAVSLGSETYLLPLVFVTASRERGGGGERPAARFQKCIGL